MTEHQKLLWKPLLAATLPVTADYDSLPYPLWGSPKIDGFRVMVQHGKAVSRKGIIFRNRAVQELYGNSNYEGLDGELIVGRPWDADVFNRTQNVVNNGSVEAAKEFANHGCMMVIDKYDADASFEGRQRMLSENGALCSGAVHGHSEVIKQTLIKNTKQLLAFEDRCLKRGYEGVMLRRAFEDSMAHAHGQNTSAGEYGYVQKPGKDNRSTLNEFFLVKLKRFDYGTAAIMKFHPLRHNKNEEKTATGKRSTKKAGVLIDAKLIGSVTVIEGAKTFNITVPTNALRAKGAAWWQRQIGRAIRYKYQLHGTLNAPRILTATFKELL